MSDHRFDDITVESLMETGSMKWTRMPGHLAAFVAEMDFGTAPAVTQSLRDSTDKSLWGYLPPAVTKEMSDATSEFLARRYG
ncbi:aminotransferase class I/II, partial [Pontimonas sp.]|nr:aminotransferase class I/II [Pontimonas sp.]